jgi:hypothetical protein
VFVGLDRLIVDAAFRYGMQLPDVTLVAPEFVDTNLTAWLPAARVTSMPVRRRQAPADPQCLMRKVWSSHPMRRLRPVLLAGIG